MVMDAQPSPQSVGREFVRQYYTLLNKAPNHLHRFYNNHSSFIHGGLDSHNREATLVVGQKNIHGKIQQLNFRDCHAKISQVDAQATLGNGVVVQVTGELSNDGQPMRRFTQTFVLAAQSPKNYYVHNDIFRYQDLYSDDETEGESRSENDEEQDVVEVKIVDNNNQQNTMGQPQQIFYQIPVVAATATVAGHPQVGQNVPLPPFTTQPPQVNGVVHDEILQGIQQQQQTVQQQPTQMVPPPAVVSSPPQQQQQQQQQQQPQQPMLQQQQQQQPSSIPVIPLTTPTTAVIPQQNMTSSPLESIVVNKEIPMQPTISHNTSPDIANISDSSIKSENEIIIKDDYKSMEHMEKNDVIKMSQNEPKTYANLFKSISNSTGSGFVPLPTNNHHHIGQSTGKQQDQRSENIQSTGLPQRNSSRQMKDFPERRTSTTNTQFGDSHQLFLGNVPHHATEEELKMLFSKFGTVVDLRIHSKSAPKGTGTRLTPNFGFITYEDPESVQNCLANCPLYFPDNSPDGQKLNVEEKKTRLRGSNDIQRLPPNNMSSGGGGGGVGGLGNNQRPTGGQNRSMSNSGGGGGGGGGGAGGMMRGSSGGPVRGTPGGPRPTGGSFTRNDRGPGGPPPRGNSNGPSNTGGGGGGGGGNTYGRR